MPPQDDVHFPRIGSGETGPGLVVRPIGRVESALVDPARAPRQGDEGAPNARLVVYPEFNEGLRDVRPGEEIIVLTWLHLAEREVLVVRPRSDPSRPMQGVFSTRSPARPNPIGLHRVTVLSADGSHLDVSGIEAVDGTPILDIKPVLRGIEER